MSSHAHEALAHRRKRVRFSGDDSSEPSISDESALVSTSLGEQSTDASDVDSDSGSELSESSEEPSDDSSDDDESDGDNTEMELEEHKGQDGVVNLRANRGKKPTMKLNKEELGPDIRDFLKDFLPQLKAANDELLAQKKAGTLKSLDAEATEDGESYIEMDLGLGVLEVKDPSADESSESESDREDETGRKDENILGKLMGRANPEPMVGIEVVQDNKNS
ncbi:hypothetical protein BKA66DRAFT_573003 [Pyrenochaeta sp. MPI-SDFR-AT-0127]|nr:hypothetical protein BKA66DRAFT_573003 [Pyrenochaeta sp. MPI-SDFR-AT-0127]